MTEVSVIIRTRNEAQSLRKVLEIIANQDTNFSYEIVLVDSYSTDDTKHIAEKYGCKIVNLSQAEFSWGRGLNIGIENSEGKFCILLSAHCYPVNNKWMNGLVEPLIEDERVAANYGGQIPIKGVDPFEEVELKEWFPTNKSPDKKRVGISNSNACIRKEVWRLFKFNETLSSYEDAEWAMRVQNAGYLLKYVSEAAVFHSHRISVKSIYIRWYWRSRMAIYLRQKEKKIALAGRFWPNGVAFTLALIFYTIWFYKSIFHCVKEKYYKDIWKAPFYELIRMYALYRGCCDGLKDVKYKYKINEFLYFKTKIPLHLSMFTFIEK
jgi:glycosyltransferase involved in cell wall biosynthesis